MWQQLGAEAALGALASQKIQDVAQWQVLPVGSVITKGESLFPRLAEEAAV
jgi:methionyl-tRNA synthetase